MDTLQVTDEQKQHLQSVADGVRDVYNVLARMRYLDPDWIEAGPHDLTDRIQDFRSVEINDDIIYLYILLPYVYAAHSVHCFEASEFIDYRTCTKAVLARLRDPTDIGKKAYMM
ncbi:hypothetical protein VHEMI07087 [[Torrubiella] hemipterigena]|uniref:Uncharacterized protein n=1 Tax=[Torrubiella] hemipterigena TaxID=1531966 RepID=A0A0A1T999_9HYPO|nr:hypothetical protein VHEMI07087 [[Torrubiella] hemipterigena]